MQKDSSASLGMTPNRTDARGLITKLAPHRKAIFFDDLLRFGPRFFVITRSILTPFPKELSSGFIPMLAFDAIAHGWN